MDTLKQKTKISILIVNFKQSKQVVNLISKLKRDLTDYILEINIYDNTPNSLLLTLLHLKNVKPIKFVHQSAVLYKKDNIGIYKCGTNIGYSSAINYLASKSAGDLFIILNPDIKILKNFSKPISFYKKAAITQPAFSLGEADKLYTVPFFTHLFNAKKRFSSYGFIVPRNLFNSVGGFDNRFFLYFEDDDFAYTLIRFGLKTKYPKNPYIAHLKTYTNISFIKRKSYYYDSLNFFLYKNKRLSYYLFYFPILFLKLLRG
ncbi:hypothetical protein COV24_04925 [candidate division WWE3 bacterium CG10_big_fil_rev_8_21_14_0_10_32_10]|uniref:Glycosyltransferase 2-like domain-containing protein n=1 Tax=candidate division WWE3 bacterium CG10_big_fil_rev_8_21_14_0_10_32_10 TaxID=1975090 RepID=A0A2H0R8W4_UNCKA|nr:MAG: hypothetical protein COV24_04925 [candidate division WWE3 bacterium CG10_big_fil_rev_8_21_14_0_10_32_10]